MACKKRAAPLLRSKKAISHEMFLNVFELVLATIVMLALLSFVKSVVNNSIFEKNYLSRDTAILLNTIYAAPGDVSYSYKENTGKSSFIFKFSPGRVEINDASDHKSVLDYVSGVDISSKKGEGASHEKEDQKSNAPVFYLFAENKNFALTYATIETGFAEIRVPFKDSYRVQEEGITKINFIKSENSIKISDSKE